MRIYSFLSSPTTCCVTTSIDGDFFFSLSYFGEETAATNDRARFNSNQTLSHFFIYIFIVIPFTLPMTIWYNGISINVFFFSFLHFTDGLAGCYHLMETQPVSTREKYICWIMYNCNNNRNAFPVFSTLRNRSEGWTTSGVVQSASAPIQMKK